MTQIEKLCGKAQELADRFEYELAMKFCKKALEIDPKNFDCLHMLASFSVELSDSESAIQSYQQLIQLYPNDYNAYIAIAELLSSIEYYEKGLKIFLSREHADKPTLVDIYCSLAELYLLTEEKENIEQASRYLDLAESSSSGKDAQISYLRAQLATSKDLPKKEIILHLDQCLSLLSSDSNSGTTSNYDMRFEVSKLLYSFGTGDGVVMDNTIQTLYDLLAEQEDDPDVCFLLGKALTENSTNDEDMKDGKLLLSKAKKLYQQIDTFYHKEQIGIIDEILSSC